MRDHVKWKSFFKIALKKVQNAHGENNAFQRIIFQKEINKIFAVFLIESVAATEGGIWNKG